MKYKAFVVDEIDGKFQNSIKYLETRNLEANELLVKVSYSSLNYKDALSATGNKGVTKKYPHVPGIDAAGVVVESTSDLFRVGDEVIVSGNDLGMNTAGGFAEYIQVPANWAVKLPQGLSAKEAMIIGTAGFTAGISVSRLNEIVKPSDGKIVVSGATGGVGSMAISILSKLGYQVVAVSGKSAENDFIMNLGASEIISREAFLEMDKKPILSAQFAGGIDVRPLAARCIPGVANLDAFDCRQNVVITAATQHLACGCVDNCKSKAVVCMQGRLNVGQRFIGCRHRCDANFP